MNIKGLVINKVRFLLVEEFLPFFLKDTSSTPCLSSPVFPKWDFTIKVNGLIIVIIFIIIIIKLIVLLSSNLPNALKLQYKKA